MRPNETQLISPCQVNCISSGSVCLSQFESLSFKHGYVEECKVLYAHAKQKNLKTKRLPLPSKQWSHTFQFLLETFIMELQQSFPLQPHAVALCHIVLTRVFNLSWDFSKWRIHRFFRNLLSLVHKCMTHYTSFILIVSAVLHVWQFDPLLYWQCPRFSLKKKKKFDLCIPVNFYYCDKTIHENSWRDQSKSWSFHERTRMFLLPPPMWQSPLCVCHKGASFSWPQPWHNLLA